MGCYVLLGTLLDGKPIINLPPKVIELKQVDFTQEERDFYNQLEIDSRDQFKVSYYGESSFAISDFLLYFMWLIFFLYEACLTAFAYFMSSVRNMRLLEL